MTSDSPTPNYYYQGIWVCQIKGGEEKKVRCAFRSPRRARMEGSASVILAVKKCTPPLRVMAPCVCKEGHSSESDGTVRQWEEKPLCQSEQMDSPHIPLLRRDLLPFDQQHRYHQYSLPYRCPGICFKPHCQILHSTKAANGFCPPDTIISLQEAVVFFGSMMIALP